MNFGSKPKGLAFGFTKKHLITMRTDQKSIFHPCEILILARLDITVLYTIFLWFWKFLSFAWELKGFRLRFYLQTSVHSENRSKICISSPWDTYSFLVRHYGGVYIFFRFWKISSFDLKSKDEITYELNIRYINFWLAHSVLFFCWIIFTLPFP
jgi:hypothetical protein